MFNTFLHFAIFAYPHKLGRCIVNKTLHCQCRIRLSSARPCSVHVRRVFL